MWHILPTYYAEVVKILTSNNFDLFLEVSNFLKMSVW